MTNARRRERAVWKLSQAGYAVRRDEAGRYIVTGPRRHTYDLAEMAALVALADAIYADHWTGRKITLSA